MTYKDTLLSDTFTVKMSISEVSERTVSWLHSKKASLTKPEKADQIIAYYTKPLRWTGETVGLVRFNFSESSEGTVVGVDFPTYHKVSDLEPSEVLPMQDYLPEFFRMYRMHMGVGIDEKWLKEMYPEDRRRALVSMDRNSGLAFFGLGVLSLFFIFSNMNWRVDSGVDFVDGFFILISVVLLLAGFCEYWLHR
jgi:hypothetical protein